MTCALEIGFDKIKSIFPFSSKDGIKPETEKIEMNNPPAYNGKITNIFIPFAMELSKLVTLPLTNPPEKDSAEIKAKRSAKTTITNVETEKKKRKIFFDRASRKVSTDKV